MSYCTSLSGFTKQMKQLCISAECHFLSQIANNYPSKHTALFGHSSFASLLEDSALENRFLFTQELTPLCFPGVHTCTCNWDELPTPNDQFDCIILPHTLEITACPREQLQVFIDALQPEGKMILFGLNPLSPARKSKPYDNRPQQHSPALVSQLLRECGCDIKQANRFLYSLGNPKQTKYEADNYTEKSAKLLFPYFSCLYMIVAQKKVANITPLKSHWKCTKIIANPS